VIAIISYGVGNVRAFANIYERLGFSVIIASSQDELRRATHLILPGVGAFDWAVCKLADSGLLPTLEELVFEKQRPILGVCVGMQMLAIRSEEGKLAGLGWVDAEVRKLGGLPDGKRLPLPHMGWNDISTTGDALFNDLGQQGRFYFLHSFHIVPQDESIITAYADYGQRFVCAIRRGNIFGVQFHPEKSHRWGELLLKNFARV
jgi:glutamine amidotransferase